MNILCVLIGGGIGALLRYISSQYINAISGAPFPLGTLFVNITGSLIIGFVFNIFQTHAVSIGLRLFLITGFLGGFTTFSAYSLETAQYLLNGNIKQAMLNIALNNIVCLLFAIIGIWISKIILK